MNAKNFLKWGAISVCTLLGLVYAASCLFVAERGTRFLWTSIVAPISSLFARQSPEPWIHTRLPFVNGSFLRVEVWREVQQSVFASFMDGEVVRGGVEIVLFLVLLAIPVVVAYRFLIRPIRQFQLIYPETLRDLAEAGNRGTREDAADAILSCMLSAPDSAMDNGEREEIQRQLCGGREKVEFAQELLKRREAKAKEKALEIAKMAALTVAVSSSAMGDGLGMFFWKSKLVYETFRIYGFRPDLRSTVSIYLHVVFASFFAASVEELCEILDFGGLGGRFVQGGVGWAVVLKGGYLTRAYLTQGITAEARKQALSEFKSSTAGGALQSLMETALKPIVGGGRTEANT